MDLILLFVILLACTTTGVILGWWGGRVEGRRSGFRQYAEQLRFERRPDEVGLPLIEPSFQPHSRRPRGHARTSEAHMSQPRANWSAPSDD